MQSVFSVLLGDSARVMAADGTLITTVKSGKGFSSMVLKDSGSVKKIHPDWIICWSTTAY